MPRRVTLCSWWFSPTLPRSSCPPTVASVAVPRKCAPTSFKPSSHPSSWAPPTAQRPVRHVVASFKDGLRSLLSVPEGYEIVLGNGGASAFWDVACACPMTRARPRFRGEHSAQSSP